MTDRVLIDKAKAHIGFNKALHEEQYVCLEAVMSGQDGDPLIATKTVCCHKNCVLVII